MRRITCRWRNWYSIMPRFLGIIWSGDNPIQKEERFMLMDTTIGVLSINEWLSLTGFTLETKRRFGKPSPGPSTKRRNNECV